MHEHDSIFEQIVDRGHERLCFHHDKETGLKAIVAIHSTALGNALGGTRRWYYESEEDAIFDVLRLSKGMTYKAAVFRVGTHASRALQLKCDFVEVTAGHHVPVHRQDVFVWY